MGAKIKWVILSPLSAVKRGPNAVKCGIGRHLLAQILLNVSSFNFCYTGTQASGHTPMLPAEQKHTGRSSVCSNARRKGR